MSPSRVRHSGPASPRLRPPAGPNAIALLPMKLPITAHGAQVSASASVSLKSMRSPPPR